VTIICLSFLIIGIFLSMSNNLKHTARQISQDLLVVVFLEKDLPEDQITLIEEEMKRSDLVSNIRFINEEQAFEAFKNRFPNLRQIVDNLETNPFPPSFEATLNNISLSAEDIQPFLEKMEETEGIEDVQFNKDWVKRMESLSRLVRAVGLFLGGILVLASFLIISNVIKLNVMARKEEIEILRFIGATNTFIRIPFVLEGTILGILAGMLSLVLLLVLVTLFPIYLGSSLGVLNELINFRYLTFIQGLGVVFGGAFIGSFGSFTSLERFLKTREL
jgi:cell division transport system permease protein